MDADRATTSGTRSERNGWLTVGTTVTAAPDWTFGNDAPSYLDITGSEIVFVLIGAITLGAALLCVTSRNVVRAALWLVVALGGLAGLYLVLTAELVAIVQLLIYVGAVVVLLLFGLMVTAAPIGQQADLNTANRPIAIGVAIAGFGLLVAALVDAFRFAYLDLGIQDQGSAETIGAALFSSWVLPFEVLSVLLLAALIGAIAITRRDVGSQGHR
ncbi:MAG: NADH-quinone oxidoreductase subunit J [Geodermatophilaceae bacterium]|nr:NADH-quinone oxidoreductase subunit J [Geodermatophilaceae bacterium]